MRRTLAADFNVPNEAEPVTTRASIHKRSSAFWFTETLYYHEGVFYLVGEGNGWSFYAVRGRGRKGSKKTRKIDRLDAEMWIRLKCSKKRRDSLLAKIEDLTRERDCSLQVER